MAKYHGKRGSLTFDATAIPFKVIGNTGERNLANGTDSSNYDADTDTLYRYEEEGETGIELQIEFIFNSTVTKAEILDLLIAGGTLVRAIVNLNPSTVMLDADCILSQCEYNIDVNDMVNGTATIRSVGKFWHGTRP